MALADGYTDGKTYCRCTFGASGNTFWFVGDKARALALYGAALVNAPDLTGPNLPNLSAYTLVEIGTRSWDAAARRWILAKTDQVNDWTYTRGESANDDALHLASETAPDNNVCSGPFPEDLCGPGMTQVNLKVLSCSGKTFTRLTEDTGGFPGPSIPGENETIYPQDYDAAKASARAGEYLTINDAAAARGDYFYATDTDVLYCRGDQNDGWLVCAPGAAPEASSIYAGHQGDINAPGIVYPDDYYVILLRSPAGQPRMLSGEPGAIVDVQIITDDAAYGFSPVYDNRLSTRYVYNTREPNGAIRHVETDYALYDTYVHAPQPGGLGNFYGQPLSMFHVEQSGAYDRNGNVIPFVRGNNLFCCPPWIEEGRGYDFMLVLRLPQTQEFYLPYLVSPESTEGFIACSTDAVISGQRSLRIRTMYHDDIDGDTYADDWIITAGNGPVSGGPKEPNAPTNALFTDAATSRDLTTVSLEDTSAPPDPKDAGTWIAAMNTDESSQAVAPDFEDVTGQTTVWRNTLQLNWLLHGPADKIRVLVIVDIPRAQQVFNYDATTVNDTTGAPHLAYRVTVDSPIGGVPGKMTYRIYELPGDQTSLRFDAPPLSNVRAYVRAESGPDTDPYVSAAAYAETTVILHGFDEDPANEYVTRADTYIRGETYLNGFI